MRRSQRQKNQEAEINITAFLNLMVVLIPFLLITAVFSQVSVLELNLPSGNQNDTPEGKQALVLEMTIRASQLEIGDRNDGTLKVLNKINGQHDFIGAHEFLKKVKQQFPKITEIALLLEDHVEYDVLIKAMDNVRLQNTLINGQVIKTELFPNIAIGSAADLANTADASGTKVNTSTPLSVTSLPAGTLSQLSEEASR
ncbi:MAG: biopolymer transporter ExbD [Gammaproteobacteria bacterium]|nr:MAG: biopolymer transporter ExbD [Gammaproteobacteria bacterium]